MRRRRAGWGLDPPIRRADRRTRQGNWIWLGGAALLFLLSLGAVGRVSAMPAEARTPQTWYAYQQELRYDFTARVRTGPIYSRDLVSAGDLIQTRLPVEPAAYRRVVVGPLAESLRITLPYRFTADREALLHLTYRIDGEMQVPNLWRRGYPLLPERSVKVRAGELRLDDLSVEIPVREIMAEVSQLREELEIPFDQVELRIRPIFQLEVDGQPEPVSATLSPEFLVLIRSGGYAIELDEPRTVSDHQEFQSESRVPLTVNLWGWQLPIAHLRWGTYLALGLFTALLLAGLITRWMQHRRDFAGDLQRLGPGLIRAAEFIPPDGMTLVTGVNPEQLLQLHLQTERPVIQVGRRYYLIDGTTCYQSTGT